MCPLRAKCTFFFFMSLSIHCEETVPERLTPASLAVTHVTPLRFSTRKKKRKKRASAAAAADRETADWLAMVGTLGGSHVRYRLAPISRFTRPGFHGQRSICKRERPTGTILCCWEVFAPAFIKCVLLFTVVKGGHSQRHPLVSVLSPSKHTVDPTDHQY